jgi:hypothetical protein
LIAHFGRVDQVLDKGDMSGAETWHRILNAIERLQAKAPAEKVHHKNARRPRSSDAVTEC